MRQSEEYAPQLKFLTVLYIEFKFPQTLAQKERDARRDTARDTA